MTQEEIATGLTAINEQLKSIFSSIKKVEHTLNGNGQPGLVERVCKLEARTSMAVTIVEVLAYILTTGIAAYAAFYKP